MQAAQHLSIAPERIKDYIIGVDKPKTDLYIKAEQVIESFIQGSTLNAALQVNQMNASAFTRQMQTYGELLTSYRHAKECIADLIASETIEISDDENEDPNSRRIRIEARRWLASKYHRRQYGDNVQVEVTGQISLVAAIAEGKSRALTSGRTIEHEAEPIQCVSAVQPENVSD